MDQHGSLPRRVPIGIAVAGLAATAFPALAKPPGAGEARGVGVGGDDFVTGGGWIDGTPSGERANFGVKGGVNGAGELVGHLNYVDRREHLHVHSESIDSYAALDATTRRITGTARVGKESGVDFTVTVSDEGEPGRDDTFEIELSTGYSASGTLEGGNIQLHE